MATLIDVAIDKKVGVSLPFFYFFYVLKGCVVFILNNNDEEIVVKENQGVLINKNVSVDMDFSDMDEQSTNIRTVRITSDTISRFNYLNYMRSGFNIGEVNRSGFQKSNYCKFDFRYYTDSERNVLRSLTTSIEQGNSTTNKKLGSQDEHVLFYEYTLLLGILSANNPFVESVFHDVSSETVSEKAARLVMNDYCKTWNVSTLSSELNMSESTFKKKMHKEVGAVSEFVNKLKIVESLRRLRRTTDSLTEISSDLGYCSSSYFTQVFYRHLGVLPSKIRDYFEQE